MLVSRCQCYLLDLLTACVCFFSQPVPVSFLSLCLSLFSACVCLLSQPVSISLLCLCLSFFSAHVCLFSQPVSVSFLSMCLSLYFSVPPLFLPSFFVRLCLNKFLLIKKIIVREVIVFCCVWEKNFKKFIFSMRMTLHKFFANCC